MSPPPSGAPFPLGRLFYEKQNEFKGQFSSYIHPFFSFPVNPNKVKQESFHID